MAKQKQLLHLVFGGELDSIDGNDFGDLSKLDIVGIYPNFAEAKQAWQEKARSTVDNAQTRYFVVHIHRLMEPEEDPSHCDEDHEATAEPLRAVGGRR